MTNARRRRRVAYVRPARRPAGSGAGPHLPAPQTVSSPRMKSVGSAGMGKGRQRSWLGVTTPCLKSAARPTGKLMGWKGSCVTEGRIRYSQLRRFSLRPPGGGRCSPAEAAAQAEPGAPPAAAGRRPSKAADPAALHAGCSPLLLGTCCLGLSTRPASALNCRRGRGGRQRGGEWGGSRGGRGGGGACGGGARRNRGGAPREVRRPAEGARSALACAQRLAAAGRGSSPGGRVDRRPARRQHPMSIEPAPSPLPPQAGPEAGHCAGRGRGADPRDPGRLGRDRGTA